ncbi:hypothetical protein C8R44DRAFT_888915 [Mycena epipterygia]|nr:hypothetical protein C8R44DRAFT_888915 [Mycena epipterygia]
MRRVSRRSAFTLKNGQNAIALNNQFKTLTATSSCTAGKMHASMIRTTCAGLPLVNSAGTSITCYTAEDIQTCIAATGASDPDTDATAPLINNSITGSAITANATVTNSTTATSSAGNFVNATTSYFAAPQQLNSDGLIIGRPRSRKWNPLLRSTRQPQRTRKKFIAFQGIDAPAVNGIVTVTLTKGLPAGFYRLCSINTAANHQPVIVPVAQHGSLDDCVYFTAQ